MFITTRNVNTGFRVLIDIMSHPVGSTTAKFPIIAEETPTGEVNSLAQPLLLAYLRPKERVLFNSARDLNPAACLYRALWGMSGGSENSDWLEAYGGSGAEPSGHSYLLRPRGDRIDMTVFSHKACVLDTCGVDFVVYSILHEYKALVTGLKQGRLYHFINDLSARQSDWRAKEWSSDTLYNKHWSNGWYEDCNTKLGQYHECYPEISLIKDRKRFDEESEKLVEYYGKPQVVGAITAPSWSEPFLQKVARPVLQAFHAVRWGQYVSAKGWVREIESTDWRIVMTDWVDRKISDA